MSVHIPEINDAGCSSMFDESDLASDIEADLQDLTVEDDFESTATFSLRSSSPFTGSFSSLLSSDIGVDTSSHSSLKQPYQHQIYLRQISLKSIHTQLLNADLKDNCGSPSCISLQSFIALGTTNGFLFVFDRRQKLVFSINTGATEVGYGQGPITCLSQNFSSTRLLVGFGSGRIGMWQLPKGNVATNDDIVDDCTDEKATVATPDDAKSRKQKSPGGLLRIIDDAHQIGQSIIACAFTSLPTVAVAMDSSGSAYEMDFRRGVLGRSTQSFCFFSGSHGEICAIAPLRPTHTNGILQNYQHHPAFSALLASAMIAMASFTKVIVVVLKPKFRVVFWQHLKGSPSCLPQLTWFWCLSDTQVPQSSGESIAYLGFARASTLYVARIATLPLNSSADVPSGVCAFGFGGRQFMHRVQLSRSISIEQRIVSMHFFTLDYLALLDSEEILRIFDVSAEHEVESLNLSTTQICYNSGTFKALAIGGEVSEALACASERACANSITSSGGRLIVLGKSGVTLISLKSWTDRAISLFKAERLEEALTCCCQVLRDDPSLGVRESLLQVLSHMPLTQAKRRPTLSIVSNLIAICVRADLSDFLQSSVIPAYRQDVLTYPLLMRCLCQYLLTLPPIYSFSPSADINDCFLRFLTPDVTMEMLTWCIHGPTITMPPSTVKDSLPATDSPTTTSLNFSVTWKSSFQKIENGSPLAESCLVRFSPISLDIDRVLKLCISNGLYQGFIYIYAFVLRDHEAAFRWLTDLLIKRVYSPFERKNFVVVTRSASEHSISSSTDSLENLNTTEAVNAILLFLRSSFAGEEVFGIPLDPNSYFDVPNKVFNLLLSSQVSLPEYCKKSILSQPDAIIACTAPRLRVLLHFGSTVDLLNMLTLALRDNEFFASKQPSSTDPSCQRRQRLLTTLIACALDESGQNLFPIDASAVIHIVCFVGEQVLQPENSDLAFDMHKIVAVLKFIAKHFDVCMGVNLPWMDLSDVLHRLLKAKKLEATAELLKAAEDIYLYDFCEHVYLFQGNTVAVLSCLLTSLHRVAPAGPVRNTLQVQDLVSRIFVFLSSCLTSPQTGSSFGLLANRFLQSVEIYGRCDALRCLFLLVHSIGPSMRRILHALDTVFMSDEPLPNSLLNLRSSVSPISQPFPTDVAFSAEGPHHPVAICILRPFYELIHSNMPELEREIAVASVGGDANLRLALDELLSKSDPLVAELYVRLLLSANAPMDRFQEHRTLCDFLRLNCEYRASILLELLDKEAYPQELACIYEKIGDWDKATELLKKDFLVHWNGLVDNTGESVANNQSLREEVMSRACVWFAFAARRCISKRSSENELPWFVIIDALSALRKVHLSDQLTLWLNDIFHRLLESANSYVPTPALINRVLQHSNTTAADFDSATNKFLLQLVGVWHKEVNLMQDCHRLMTRDISLSEQVLVSALKRGIGVRRYSCALCGLSFALRYRRLRSRVTSRLHAGGFTTLAERDPLGSEIMLIWCGHGVHVDCYENCRERLKTRMSGIESYAKKYVCLQCNSIIDPSAPPLLSARGSRGDALSSLLISTQHLLDVFDEIEVSKSYHNQQPSRRSQKLPSQAQSQRSTNPFDEDIN